jgi:hypothetical protein
MSRDILFLLKHDFPDGAERWYCPECAEMNGVLSYYPALRHHLDVRYVDFHRPRPEVIALVGEANQSCPVLVLASKPAADLAGITLGEHAGCHFISGSREIATYLARAHGSGLPH